MLYFAKMVSDFGINELGDRLVTLNGSETYP